MTDLQNLYRDAVRRHAERPVGRGRRIEATHRCELFNAQCGDRVEVRLQLGGETIEATAFDGEGCAICMASASLLCEHLPGRTRSEARRLHDDLFELLTGRVEPDQDTPLAPLSGVRPFPSRVQCAALPWQAAVRALDDESE